jgi:hypothetical protein
LESIAKHRTVTISSKVNKKIDHEVIPRDPYDFANILRTVVCTEQLLAESWPRSCHQLEQNFKPKSIKSRGSIAGDQSSGLFAKHRRGDCIPLLPLRQEIGRAYPSVQRIDDSILWYFLCNGAMPDDDFYRHVEKLEDKTFWAIHAPLQPFNSTGRTLVFKRMITNDLLYELAGQGSLDALLGLIALLLQAKKLPDPVFAFRIGQFIPAVVTLLSVRGPFVRVGPLILARLRQLALDDVVYEGKQMSLSFYDVRRLAKNAQAWEATRKPDGMSDDEYIRQLNDTMRKGKVVRSAFVEALLPSFCPVKRNKKAPKWRTTVTPHVITDIEAMAESDTTFTKKALDVFEATLGAYWK